MKIYFMRLIILLSIGLLFFNSPAFTQQVADLVIGKQMGIKSTILNENRILNIYLPEGYHKDSSIQYPVIYLLDGSMDEDFIHLAGIVQYQSFPWINATPLSIVVGISNIDRKRDFTFPTTIEKDKIDFPTTGGSEKFIAFIEKEVQPFIEQKFHTSNQKTIVGQSLGGLLATEILLSKPTLFTHYLIVSPSLWWDNESLLKRTPQLTSNVSVHISVGKEGKVMETDTKKLYQLIHKNHPNKTRVTFEYLKQFNHGDVLHQATYNGFLKLFSVTKIH